MRALSFASILALAVSISTCGSDKNTAAVNPPATDTLADSTWPAVSTVTFAVAYPNVSFSRPLDIKYPPDNTNRAFVVEQEGAIRMLDNSTPTTSVATTFLDITGRVNSTGNEEGLLGLAFHPDFANNHYFYVNYTAANPRRTVISRFTATGDSADSTSELVILTFDQPYSNHNGGCLMFGPDNYLYIATGDGGSGGDPQGNGQNTRTLLGKILRIDVDHPSAGRNYGIPADNPFAAATDGRRGEIFAYGLRNPWRFSFDRQSGLLWAGDVGQDEIEEIDIIENGKNYGWNIMEGSACYNPSSNCQKAGLTLPVAEYTHSTGQSVTGGYVYRGTKFPTLVGTYLYADFVSGRVWGMRSIGGKPRLLASGGLNISSFGEGVDGELYVTAFDGKIYTLITAQ